MTVALKDANITMVYLESVLKYLQVLCESVWGSRHNVKDPVKLLKKCQYLYLGKIDYYVLFHKRLIQIYYANTRQICNNVTAIIEEKFCTERFLLQSNVVSC